MEHDTRQIRSAARRIGTVAASVKDISSSDLRSISNSIPNNFQGESAEALQEAVSNLIDDLNQMSIGLNNIKASLYPMRMIWTKQMQRLLKQLIIRPSKR